MPHPTAFRTAMLMALASAAIVVNWGGSSAAATSAVPEVLSVYATPSALGPSGGTVTVMGRVKNARDCQLEVLSRQSFPVVYSHNPTTCQDGAFSAHVLIGANPSPLKRTVAFALVARDGKLSSTGAFYVSVAPLLAPSVLSAYATPSALGPSGGTVTVMGRVKNARDCQLEVLSRQSFPVVYSHNPTTCQDGDFSAHVLIGANPSPLKRTVAFALVARDGKLSSTGAFYVSVAPLLAPSVLSVYATPSALGPSGGTVTVMGRVKNARDCQLEVLSRQSFPVVYSHNPTTCQDGDFSAHVLIGANPSPLKRTVAFALVARDGKLSSTGAFYVSLALRPPYLPPPPPPPPPPLPSRYAPGSTGYDVSWPQCQAPGSALTKPLPNAPTFAVVGINDGTIGGFNSCFAAEAAWAGQGLSVYIILQPAPSGSRAAFETSGPKSSCAATNQQCAAYNWGYNYAEADLAFARAQSIKPQIWWLDVETAEGWGTSAAAQPANGAVVQGALDVLTGAGETAGIDCTWYQWGQITGSYTPAAPAPIWVAGATSLGNGYYSAQSYCQRALAVGDPSTLGSKGIGFAGGTPWLVQYAYTPGPVPVDNDYACG